MTKEDINQIVTFGCRLNAFESKQIEKAVEKSSEKNLIIFNSCAVTSQAESDLRAAIRKARKNNPDKKIIVTGCAAQIDPKKYAAMAEVDLVLGNKEKSDHKNYHFKNNVISEVNSKKPKPKTDFDADHKDKIFFEERSKNEPLLEATDEAKIKVNNIMSVRDTAPQLVSYFDDQTRAFLEIQNGCNHRCTFCIIPFGRGNSRSVPFGEIVSQVKKMTELGHKEVVLTGVDISSYGEDLPGKIKFSDMIKRLLKLVPNLPRLRLSSIDVAEIDDGFFDILKNEPRFMPYFHLSMQSGDDIILKRMKRRHSREQILQFCQKARQANENVTFGADIIAGFPTETEENFTNSLNLINEAKIIFNHIFPYSIRQGTPAAKMPQINGSIIKTRAKKLRQEGAKELQKYLEKQIGKEMKILLEKNNKGKSENFLDVEITGEKLTSGQIITAKIIAAKEGYLLANKL